MAAGNETLKGLFIRNDLGKTVHKGEDTFLQQPSLTWTCPGGTAAPFAAFGVFDGHGGKAAASFCSKSLLNKVLAALDDIAAKPEAVDVSELVTAHTSAADKSLWEAQDTLVQRLPMALVNGFEAADAEFKSRHLESGATATLAVIVGWELLVANVGDSLAYLDTGMEVIQVCGNHRLDDNTDEQERVLAAGGEVAQSCIEDGKGVGPLRVWPGGLAMSRTIGDASGGDVVSATPDVRQATLPSAGGRLIIASDGLWDCITPKTALHGVRGMTPGQAARHLEQSALKARGLRDDITVVVVDMLPTPDCRIPPVLDIQKRGVAAVMSQSPASPFSFDLATTSTDAVHAWKPLDSQTADPQWRRRTFLRREWVLEHLLHAAAPEEYPPTEQDGSKEEAYEIVECNRESIAPSDTYQELLNLRLDPSQLDEVESAQADDGEWEMVPGRKKGEDVDYEFLAFAVPGLGPKKLATESAVSLQEVKPRTQGRGGRGRSSLMQDGGRGRGRGRNRGRVQNACNSGNREQAKIEREPQSRLHTEDGGNRVLVVPLKPRAAEHHQQDASHPRASSNNRGGRRGRGYSRGRGGRLEGKGFVEDGSQDALQMHDKRPDSMRGHSRHLRGGYRSPAHEKDLDPASSGRGRGSRGGYRGRGRGRGRGIGERRMPAIQEKNVSDPHQEQSTTME